MTELVTAKIKQTTHFEETVGLIVPVVKQYQHNDKYRHTAYAQNKTASEMRTRMQQIGGQTRDRLRKKLEDKESKQKS